MTCTFFGHRNTPREVALKLNEILVDLIEKMGVANFLVGNQGDFDKMVRRQLLELKEIYPIKLEIVLAYLPNEKNVNSEEKEIDTIFPEGIEKVPRKFAINYRNKWMIEQSDYVVTYVKHTIGGAAEFKEYSEKKNKKVINIAI